MLIALTGNAMVKWLRELKQVCKKVLKKKELQETKNGNERDGLKNGDWVLGKQVQQIVMGTCLGKKKAYLPAPER